MNTNEKLAGVYNACMTYLRIIIEGWIIHYNTIKYTQTKWQLHEYLDSVGKKILIGASSR